MKDFIFDAVLDKYTEIIYTRDSIKKELSETFEDWSDNLKDEFNEFLDYNYSYREVFTMDEKEKKEIIDDFLSDYFFTLDENDDYKAFDKIEIRL